MCLASPKYLLAPFQGGFPGSQVDFRCHVTDRFDQLLKIEENKMEEAAVKPTVLIVDDAPENLMIMESILAKYYSLKLFNDAKKALDYAFANPPDLILLDIMMPNIDGFEACRRIKANPELVDIPVIFITSKK